jgi:hypothetical protein
MSNEITFNTTLRAKNGNLDYLFAPGTLLFDQTSQVAVGGVQVIGTATNAEAIALGDVTTAGFAVFRNLDTANYVDIGTGTGTSFVASMRLYAGQPAVAPLHPTNVPTARANSAACNLQYFILSR